MKKQVLYKTRGHRADIGLIEIHRLLSNNHVEHVGPFVVQGPFVMNSQTEIYEAYVDYKSGKYGNIVYN